MKILFLIITPLIFLWGFLVGLNFKKAEKGYQDGYIAGYRHGKAIGKGNKAGNKRWR